MTGAEDRWLRAGWLWPLLGTPFFSLPSHLLPTQVLRKEVCGHRSSEMTQGFATKEAQVHLAMPFTNCVALSELRDLSQSWFLPRTNADNNYITW